MKKPFILSLVWLGVAIAAFVIGRTSLDSTEQASADEKNSISPRVSSRASDSRTFGGASDSESSKTTRGGGSRSGVTISQYQSETDALVANKMFADLLLELKPENARSVFEALLEKGKNGGDTGQQMGLFLEAWGKIDGAAALAGVSEMDSDGRRRGFASISVMKGWASTDPEAAKAHLDGLENGFDKSMLVQGMVSGLASSDPEAATTYVLKIDAERKAAGEEGGSDDRWRGFAVDRQMEAIANAQMQRGMTEATTWAEGLPDGSIKSAAFDRVAEGFARNSPEEAAEWVKAHADKDYAERAVREISEELARKDPASAMSWAEELPEASQAAAMRTSMEQWTRDDPTAAGKHLTTMPESTARDAAVSSFAQTLDREEPALAAEWAGSISDEKTRTDTMESVARSWLRSNAEEAKEWLPQSGLSAEAQQKVIEDASRGGRRGGR
ncbi:hypothetical protein N9154_01190 [Akkermansiaceae bacterium]|nr:hypothetical protein [Akkermansiaceae bacterium]